MLFCTVVLIMFIHFVALLDFLIKLLLGWRFIYFLSWPSFQICFGTDFVIVLTFSVE
jgi:hypothetical protein